MRSRTHSLLSYFVARVRDCQVACSSSPGLKVTKTGRNIGLIDNSPQSGKPKPLHGQLSGCCVLHLRTCSQRQLICNVVFHHDQFARQFAHGTTSPQSDLQAAHRAVLSRLR